MDGPRTRARRGAAHVSRGGDRAGRGDRPPGRVAARDPDRDDQPCAAPGPAPSPGAHLVPGDPGPGLETAAAAHVRGSGRPCRAPRPRPRRAAPAGPGDRCRATVDRRGGSPARGIHLSSGRGGGRATEGAMTDGPVIALDGPASSGKSSVGAAVAAALGLRFFDSGLLYRALAWAALDHAVEPADGPGVAALASSQIFTSAPGRTTVPISRPATTIPPVSTSARWRTRRVARTSG